ncbi:MAG TPA: diadenylate cyclase CdaA [Bryobacteraceae bacterium]|jgi:diadenylate cyclase|nr:diadenylate cyclase CdaA [Bryobacteraceae bacterium]
MAQFPQFLFLNLTLRGIVDILMVAFLVYQALMVVRGTRAGHILVGIFMMVALYAISVWAGLEALRAVLSFMVPLVGLAIVVLFQSEIRRTLARLGRKRWLGFGGAFRAPEAINEILMSAEAMSSDRVGALIVLERDIGLRTFIESGVTLDARITRDLLLSIFAPGLPLHDGAVIIQKDRIAAAACFLPLTTTPALARDLGTRHRAAIGITEETDCLSIVVSEETGRISVCAFGELVQGLSLAELRERINRHFETLHPGSIRIDESPADIPLVTDPAVRTAENRPNERVNQP